MDKLTEMHHLIDQEQIHLEITCQLPFNINGFYLRRPGMHPGIAINRSIVDDVPLYCVTLAEELGHHFTSHGDFTMLFSTYRDRLAVSKAEEKAQRWATEFLLPVHGFVTAFEHGCRGLYETADFLSVTEEFITVSVEYYKRKHGTFTRVSSGHAIYFEPLGVMKPL